MTKESPPQYDHVPTKGWVRAILIIPVFIILVGLFQIAGALILGLDSNYYLLTKTSFQDMIIGLFTLTGTFVTIFIFRLYVDRESFISLGFYPVAAYRETIAGIMSGAIMITIGFFVLIILKEIHFTNASFEPVNLLITFGLFIFIAISEELIFRGYILNNLAKSMHPIIALLITSILFSIIHYPNGDFTWLSFGNLVLAGIILGLPYIYTKSLWFPIGLHFSWNFFQGPVFGFNVSGNKTYSIIHQSRIEESLINGGNFGFEGSVLSLIIQAIAIYFIWLFLKRKNLLLIKWKC